MVDLDLRMVRYFVTVAQQGSFTVAGSVLGISQPAVSQQVRRLEQILGVTLLDRSNRVLTLTPAGDALLREGEHLLAAAERAVRWTLEVAVTGNPQPIHLAFVPGTPTELVAIALRGVDRFGDPAHLQLHRIEWNEQPQCVTSGAADIAFVQLPLSGNGIELVALTTEPRVAVFRNDHRLAGRDHIVMADIAQEPIMDSDYNRSYWIVDPRPDGSSPVVVEPPVATAEAMMAFIVAGRGMSITSRSLRETYPRSDMSFVPITDLEPVTYAIAWREGERRPFVRALIDTIRRESGSNMVPVMSDGPSVHARWDPPLKAER